MKNDPLVAKLYNKMQQEQNEYRAWLLAQPPEEILNHAYEYSSREDILIALENASLRPAQLRALLESQAPLADIYKDYRDCDTNTLDVMTLCIADRADIDLMESTKKNWPPVYYQTGRYAREHEELPQYRASMKLNEECRDEIDDAISYNYNGLCLDLVESQDQVAKGNVEISKIVSSSGQSNGLELEGAGFTFFLVSDLSKLKQFEQTRSGSYTLQSILDAYIDKTYDNEHPKWDFSAETQAIAKTYEVNADEIVAYNKTLTAAGENKNGKGDGWQPTGSANEYQLAEIFSNDTGNIRVQGLPYGTYLVVETTVPHDLFQAEPFIVTVDPEQDNNPWGAMATPKDSVMTGSDSYQKFTVLDEEIEVYLRITKVDEETGKPVLLPDTAFQIYWLDEQGHYRYDSNGNPKLVTMTDTVNGHLTKDVDTFYTNSEGILTLPEKLPLGKYRIVEVTGPNGFYNEWLDSAGYENGILADDADGIYYVDFEITTDRIYAATGDKNENGMDTLVIGENYSNHETLGKLTIRKTGEVLAGWKTEVGALDPWMTGEAEDGNFVYETRPLASAEYTITAAEDIYTQDRQTDNYGKKSLLFWTWDDWKLLDDATVIMRDDTIKAEFSKKDLTTMEELPGAELTITDKDGKEIDRWVSSDKPHYIEKLPAGDYTLTEVKAPDGYAFAESVPFTALPTGEVQQFEIRTKGQSIGKGSHGSSSDSYQVTGRELMTPDEVRRMKRSDCLVMISGEAPVRDKKYNLFDHPNLKYTPDYRSPRGLLHRAATPIPAPEGYTMPPDYMAQAGTVSLAYVAELTCPEITEDLYDELQEWEESLL